MATIPGIGVVGFGFNIFKNYDQSSTTSQLFNLGALDSDTFALGSTIYTVPANVAVTPLKSREGESQVYSSREKVQDHFSLKAGITGTGFGFTGHIDSSYSKIRNSSKDYFYALVEESDEAFALKLKDSGKGMLNGDFKDEMALVPERYTLETQNAFFSFFRKFGTHYVDQVKMGGRLQYSVAIEKSFTSDETQLNINLDAEYKGAFASVKATSESEWKKVDKNWSQSRIVKVKAIGGNHAIMDALVPTVGEWKGNFFAEWHASLEANPGAVGFNLRPISNVFQGAKSDEVGKALLAYINGGILVRAEIATSRGQHGVSGHPTIICAGSVIAAPEPMPAPPKPDDRMCGIQLALFESETHKPIFNRAYYAVAGTAQVMELYRRMHNDVKMFNDKPYFCALSAFGMFSLLFPSPEVTAWLTSCGASLAQWKDLMGKTAAGSGFVCYSFVGRNGSSVGAAEDFKIIPFDTTKVINTASTARYFLYSGGLSAKQGAAE